MKKKYTVSIMALLMIFLFFGQKINAQTVSISSFGTPVSQDFNTLAITGTTNVLSINGWYLTEVGSSASNNGFYAAGTGSGTAGDTYSFGVAASTERALGGLLSGTLTPTIGASFTNNTGGNINSLSIAYTGEQWRLGTLARVDRLDFQYSLNATSLNTGTWIDIDALDFTAPVTTGTVGLLNGNTNSVIISSVIASLNIPSGSTVWVRWNDFNGTGADDGLGVDNFSLTAEGSANPTPLISINDVSLLEGNSGTTNFNFTVSLNNPAPPSGISFDISTSPNTASDGSDYIGKSLVSQTIPEGQSTYSFTVEINGDADAEPIETFFVNITNITGANVLDGQGQGTIQNDDVSIIKISDVQGSGNNSPLANTQVTIKGIVTRTFLGPLSLNGFYMQEEDADTDADPNTSEGIFVFNPSISVSQGDLVQVTGTVIDFTSGASSLTEISPISSISVVSTGNPLPSITNVSLPVANVSDLEKYEGMLINLTASSGDLVVTENFELGRFGQVILAANDEATNQTDTDARLDQYTQFNSPSISGYATYLAAIAKRTIYLDDARTSQNPSPLLLGRGGNPLSASNTLRTGDAVSNVTAILDHRFEGYRLQTVDPVNFTPANPRPGPNPEVGEATLKVGHMNVLNYFNGDGIGGGFPTSRGADNLTEFNRQKAKILNAIHNTGADIMSLNEVENDGYGSTSAIQDIVNGLNDIAGPGTWNFINPNATLATDEITVGFIYKPSKATPIGLAKTYLAGEFAAVGRGALAQTFEQNSNGAEFTAVTVHMKSKGSLTLTGTGNVDIGDGQGNNNGQRTRQAEELRDWLVNPATGITDPDIVILGDLNSYALEDPITTLETAGFGTLIPINKYSYQFDGNFGALDHALGSTSIESQTTGAIKWNINSDEPIILDYNLEFKNSGQQTLFYASDEFRSSDHDPVIVGLDLQCEKPTASISSNPENATVCETETLVLTGSGGASYSWNDGDFVEENTFSPTATGTVKLIVKDSFGCVSEPETIDVVITPITYNTITTSACDSYTWSNNEKTYTESGTYFGSTTDCITEKLVLTITPSSDNTTIISACDSYSWSNNGITYTESGTYTGTTTNCITEKLVLTITPSSINTTTAAACDSYTWANNGITYTESGTYTGTTTNCVTEKLALTITPSSDNVTTATACDSYTWANNGITYTESGTYTGTTTNCVTEKLALTITPSSTSTITLAACDSYTWAANGQTYITSGTYNFVGNCTNQTLVLTINTAGEINGQSTMCKGSKFKFTSTVLGGIWTSSNTSIVDIINNSLENGLVKAINYGTATISYTVNGCTSAFVVTVGDIIPPTIICPSPYTKAVNGNQNNCSTKVNVAAPTVEDNCGNVTVTYSLSGATTGSGSGKVGNETFNVGVTTVIYTATDDAGNSTTCTTSVTVTNPNCSIGGRISAESLVNDSQENSELSLSIRNNPSHENFKIIVNSFKNSLVKMNIYGMDGKLFANEEVTPNTEVKVGQKLNPGIYILRVQQDKLFKTIKIIKE